MRKGKMVAQGAHASMKAILDLGSEQEDCFKIPLSEPVRLWLCGNFKKICVSIPDEQSLLNLATKAQEAGIAHALITDSGLTEFKGVPTITALALGPAWALELDPLTGNLPLL